MLEDNSLVAVKMLRRDMERSNKPQNDFSENTKRLRPLCPHVVEVYEYGEEAGGHKYLVMEYLKGEGLDTIIKANGPSHPKGNELHPAIGKALRRRMVQNYSSDLKPAM